MKQHRNTAQRRLVLQMAGRLQHPGGDEVYEAVRQEDAHISRGTVYRNLNLLAELGAVKRLSMPVGPDRFDLRLDDHYHFCCRSCGKTVDIELPYNEELNRMNAGLVGYRTEYHRLVLVGLCPACIQKKEK